MSFFKKLYSHPLGSLLCIGLDTDYEKIPAWFKRSALETITMGRANFAPGEDGVIAMHSFIAQSEQAAFEIISNFNLQMIRATGEFASCFKLNLGFYLNQGVAGLKALCATVRSIHSHDVPVILDGKFADIGNSSAQYAHFAYEVIGADAVTVSPYLGRIDALEPFLGRGDKGVFVLCHTSNKGAAELQEESIQLGFSLYMQVAKLAATKWNANENCGLVAGATYPQELLVVRANVGDKVSLLVPGIGKQEGELEASVINGLNSLGTGAIFNVSRDIIYASSGEDAFQVARTRAEWYHNQMSGFRNSAMGAKVTS